MYNEEENISNTVTRVKETVEKLNINWELILVNDGSIDNTLEYALKESHTDSRVKVVSYTPNQGRGKALREGFKASAGEIVITSDFDLSYSPDHIVKIYQTFLEHPDVDVVIGSPYMKGGGTEEVAPFRLFISRAGNIILSFAFGSKVKTVTGILRGYRKKVLEALELESNGKEIHLEILSKVTALGFSVKEIPALLKPRKKGKSKFKFKATSVSHLLFSFAERPMILFGFLGFSFLLIGFILGVYIIYLWQIRSLNPVRPLMTLMVLMILAGFQILVMGFLGVQIVTLKKELLKISSKLLSIQKEIKPE